MHYFCKNCNLKFFEDLTKTTTMEFAVYCPKCKSRDAILDKDFKACPITKFMEENYKHFNARTTLEASRSYKEFVAQGNKMLVTLAGAMSTAELGITLAEMIRQDKVHAICCTGANLEEDIFHLVAKDHYVYVPNYRYLTLQDDEELLKKHCNRVTDTCIPEEEAMRRIERALLDLWIKNDSEGTYKFPHENLYELLRSKKLERFYQKDISTSWLYAACEKNIPIFVPGWEDSTTGNMFAAACIRKEVKNPHSVKTGIDYMLELAKWYNDTTAEQPFNQFGFKTKFNGKKIGFYQIGGGISGDFPICVVPALQQDLELDTELWGYFCQISDSTTSYGSYSGATPNEKITWGKLSKDTPMFVIESDATIVAPLMFKYILGQ